MAKADAQYLMVVQKVTSLSGESVQISINLPADSSEDAIYAEVKKICNALDKRMIEQNDKILAITDAMRQAEALEGVLPSQASNGRMN